MKRLPVLCPQEYAGVADMRAVPCNRCTSGWNKETKRCDITTGAEGFDPVPAAEIPACPIAERCQHQLQMAPEPCFVRRSGQVCESAFIADGMSPEEAARHPLAFNAQLL